MAFLLQLKYIYIIQTLEANLMGNTNSTAGVVVQNEPIVYVPKNPIILADLKKERFDFSSGIDHRHERICSILKNNFTVPVKPKYMRTYSLGNFPLFHYYDDENSTVDSNRWLVPTATLLRCFPDFPKEPLIEVYTGRLNSLIYTQSGSLCSDVMNLFESRVRNYELYYSQDLTESLENIGRSYTKCTTVLKMFSQQGDMQPHDCFINHITKFNLAPLQTELEIPEFFNSN